MTATLSHNHTDDPVFASHVIRAVNGSRASRDWLDKRGWDVGQAKAQYRGTCDCCGGSLPGGIVYDILRERRGVGDCTGSVTEGGKCRAFADLW